MLYADTKEELNCPATHVDTFGAELKDTEAYTEKGASLTKGECKADNAE